MAMNIVEYLINNVVVRLQHWNSTSSIYAFAAVLVVYIFIVFRRIDAS
jgi:hypothetical protein